MENLIKLFGQMTFNSSRGKIGLKDSEREKTFVSSIFHFSIYLGKARTCVIVHDFPSSKGLGTPERYRAEMGNFESMQGTTFKQSSLAMMCGKLDGPVEMQETNWEDLKEFLVKAAMTPMPSKL